MQGRVKWLVTGGAGFIGSHLAERLTTDGYDVRVVDNLSTGNLDNLAPVRDAVEFIEGDLTDPEVCRQVVAGVEVVFHVAALPSVPRSVADPWASHHHNVNATVRLIQACVEAGVRRMVYSSSSSVYGDTAKLPKIEAAEPLPRSPYAAAKLAGEQYALAFARSGLLEAVALRYFNVFGPRQDPHSAYAAIIPSLLQAALSRSPAPIFGDGQQTRDFTYVENVMDANILAALGPKALVSGVAVNIGAGLQTSILSLLGLVSKVTGVALTPDHRPPRDGDVRNSLAGLDRADRVLGYRPRIGLKEGLERTWAWFQSQSAAERASSPAPHGPRRAEGGAATA